MRPALRRAALAAAALLAAAPAVRAQGIPALDEAISGLSMPMRVLVIAAHPDDEDTQLITWLARGRHVETAYLSLTRGDGGQNIIGNELGDALGVIRTEELLAARRIDGGRQFFTRAYDFGFSKSSDEAFRHWPKDEILRDVVTVVRTFQPHVIVSIFSGTSRDGHGQHQAAGILAREAYDVAGDAARMPSAVTAGREPWTPLKFYRGGGFAAITASGDRPAGGDSVVRINVGEFNAMLGRSYAEIAGESRSQHKSQAFGALQRKGVRYTYVRLEASRLNASAPARRERSIFDGIDTTWARFKTPGVSTALSALIDRARAGIRTAQEAPYVRDPSSALPPLLELERTFTALGGGGIVDDRPNDGAAVPSAEISDDLRSAARVAYRRTVDAITHAAGIAIEAEVSRALIAAGDSSALTLSVYNRGPVPLRVMPPGFLFDCARSGLQASNGTQDSHRIVTFLPDSAVTIAPDSARVWKGRVCPDELMLRGPYWLTEPRRGDMFARRTSVAASENELTRGPFMPVMLLAQPDSAAPGVTIAAPVVYRHADQIRGDVSRPVGFVPEVSVTLDRAIEYAPARAAIMKAVRVELRSAATAPREVRVTLQLPAGLRADSTVRSVTLPAYGAVRSLTFSVRGQLPVGRHTIGIVAEANGKRFTNGYTSIEYDHIRPQRLYRDATLAIEAVDLKVMPDAVIAYIPGVGDNSLAMLQQLGLRVTALNPTAIARTDLTRYNAIVVGPRAYESSDALVANNAALLDYVKRGGTMVVQYGQTEMPTPGIMPYPITLNRPHDRVTDEASPIRILDPKARVLNYPNAIDTADFKGWLQDRSLYMPRTHAPQYAGVITTNDPGEPPNDGGILVARYGSGTYVYTTLAFFRQLPNGVPGAARIFVNLLAAKAPDRAVIP